MPDPPLPVSTLSASTPSLTLPRTGDQLDWRGAYRVARVVYDEFSFQSIYALKQGNVSSQLEGKRGEESVEKARTRVAQSKGMVAFLMFLVISAGLVTLTPGGQATLGLQLAPLEFITSVLALELLMVFSLLWMTGLQVAPTLLGSRVLPFLSTLPLTRRDMERVGLIVFARIFDVPAITAIVYLPLALGLVTGSWEAGLLVLPGTLVTVVTACAISLVTTRFFVSRVSAARGGTRGSLALRWAYLVLWSLPSLAITAFVSFSVRILDVLSLLEAANPQEFRALLLIFPFPFSYISALGATHAGDIYGLLGDPFFWVVLVAYVLAGVVCALWLRTAPLKLALLAPHSSRAVSDRGSELRVNSPTGAILHKDLRIASRSPGYAFLILLPLLDAFILGVSTYVASPNPADVERFALAAVTVAALLATFFGPAFFATEVLGFSFTRTLPISRRTLLLGKASLILIVYVVAAALVMVLVADRIGDPWPFLIVAAAELPGVMAAAFLELGVLFHKAEKTGIPITNLYSGAWWATLVVLPGLVVTGFPLLLYYAGQTYDKPWAVPSMVVAALVLLGITSSWALWGGRTTPSR